MALGIFVRVFAVFVLFSAAGGRYFSDLATSPVVIMKTAITLTIIVRILPRPATNSSLATRVADRPFWVLWMGKPALVSTPQATSGKIWDALIIILLESG